MMRTLCIFFMTIGGFCSAAWAQAFVVDLNPEEADQIRGVVRADDLAVNDIAYTYPSRLCESDGRLYLPSNSSLSDADETTSFVVKFTMQPSKKLVGELIPPNKPGEFDEEDVLNLIGTLADVGGFFTPTFCDELQRTTKRTLDFYPVISIDGHTSLRSLTDDLRSRSFTFSK